MLQPDVSDEIADDSTEIACAAPNGPYSTTFDALFVPQATALHGIPVDAASRGRVGRLWEIDEAYGNGTYWFYAVDDIMGVAVYDFEFSVPVEFSCDTPDFFCFGSYGRNMVPYFPIAHGQPADRTLLGYAWRGQPYLQSTRANEHLDVTSIVLLPKAMQLLSIRCHCDPLILSRAIASLDGSFDVLGLNQVLDDMRQARPSDVTAKAYFEAKITEAVALLLDWSLIHAHEQKHPLRPADRSALNLARTHIETHIERHISTDELCRLTCTSPSKLTRLFKHAENMTPQEYARAVRLRKACTLLEDSDRPLADIARALGYARQGSFSEAFKERYSVTPREYRAVRSRELGTCEGRPKPKSR